MAVVRFRFVKYILFFGVSLYLIFIGLQGVLEEQVFSIFYQTTARWLYGDLAVKHAWAYVILGLFLLFVTTYFLIKKPTKKKRGPAKPRLRP